MSRDLAISLLRSGNNGEQILQILETIASPAEPELNAADPTLEEIQF
jgi:hypothetical protein